MSLLRVCTLAEQSMYWPVELVVLRFYDPQHVVNAKDLNLLEERQERMEKTDGKEGIALSIIYTWTFFPYESKNLFSHFLTRTASPLSVSFCVISDLGSALIITHSGAPSPIALAFLCQAHHADLSPSLVSEDILCSVLLRVLHCKENAEPRGICSVFLICQDFIYLLFLMQLCGFRRVEKQGKCKTFSINMLYAKQ